MDAHASTNMAMDDYVSNHEFPTISHTDSRQPGNKNLIHYDSAIECVVRGYIRTKLRYHTLLINIQNVPPELVQLICCFIIPLHIFNEQYYAPRSSTCTLQTHEVLPDITWRLSLDSGCRIFVYDEVTSKWNHGVVVVRDPINSEISVNDEQVHNYHIDASMTPEIMFKNVQEALRNSCIKTQERENNVLSRMNTTNVSMAELRGLLDLYEPNGWLTPQEELMLRGKFAVIQQQLSTVQQMQNAIHKQLARLHSVERSMIESENVYTAQMNQLKQQEQELKLAEKEKDDDDGSVVAVQRSLFKLRYDMNAVRKRVFSKTKELYEEIQIAGSKPFHVFSTQLEMRAIGGD